MTGRGTPATAEPGHSLPVFDRLAPAPPPSLLAARIDLHTGPGDVVVDLAGRGGWVGRTAIDRKRRAVSLEASPLTRMLAEVVLRPPDIRHLDAAFQGLAASPRRESSLKVAIGDLFATRCATCGRTLVIDELTWSVDDEAGIAGRPRPATRHYRCTVCRDQLGGSEHRQAPLDADDRRRATTDVGVDAARGDPRAPSPTSPARSRPTSCSTSIPHASSSPCRPSGAIESDLRAAPVLTALRLTLPMPCCRPAAWPPGGPHVDLADRPARPDAERDPVPRAEPVARLRGCLPGGPRLVQRLTRTARSSPGEARRGSPCLGGGERDRGARAGRCW